MGNHILIKNLIKILKSFHWLKNWLVAHRAMNFGGYSFHQEGIICISIRQKYTMQLVISLYWSPFFNHFTIMDSKFLLWKRRKLRTLMPSFVFYSHVFLLSIRKSLLIHLSLDDFPVFHILNYLYSTGRKYIGNTVKSFPD